ncbi:MAG TPA: uroporphyrinogen decarboxylase family protein, partial [Methylomirabilota bacterium]|nr:uroporphyrinogen decarboxylase family protein [Methylomirabilota bacterium]
MSSSQPPRLAVQALVRGSPIAAPLFLPIVFSLGSKLENLALADFLSNPTKITNALKQIQAFLPCDGLACYADPYLEAEALGCRVIWDDARGARRGVTAPAAGVEISSEALTGASRIPVALDVMRRLKMMLTERIALFAGVTGPLTLSARLAGGAAPSALLLERAADVTRLIAAKYADAGMNALFIVEDAVPAGTEETLEWWLATLSPVCNVVRFYEALPVVLLTQPGSFAQARELLLNRAREFVLCLPLLDEGMWEAAARSHATNLGIALPVEVFESDEPEFEAVRLATDRLVKSHRPVLVTTAGDLPLTTDMRALPQRIQTLRSVARGSSA